MAPDMRPSAARMRQRRSLLFSLCILFPLVLAVARETQFPSPPQGPLTCAHFAMLHREDPRRVRICH
jgi:hypothetical protein